MTTRTDVTDRNQPFARPYRGDRLLRRSVDKIVAAFGQASPGFAVRLPDGELVSFGAGAPQFRIVAKHRRAVATLAGLDEGCIADAYMAGDFDIEGDLMAALECRAKFRDRHPVSNAWRFLQSLVYGQIGTNARAIKVHYDLDPEFYLSFFDRTRCYTQGIFEHPDEPLEAAIHRKFDYCISACGMQRGTRVLEVGPGWGAFTAYAAERGIRVTGLTNSVKSYEYMQSLGPRLGLEWEMTQKDFLDFTPPHQFDAIVLMGIMEHLPDYPRVLNKFRQVLKPGGVVYLDASAQRVKYELSSFIYRHIYPGNHSFFDLAGFLAAVARTPFRPRAIHDDRHSYFLTFKQWAQNFEANREQIVRRFGARHFRRFQLYLWGSAHCFLTDTLQCYRVVLDNPS
jgi:cyclopropane-fatty-acyl-phospholipid synthase